jgi:1-acyl-sn-glycerol-3-phosphate acyltransferase
MRGQGQDGTRAAINRLRVGRPTRDQPVTPLTAVGSMGLLPSKPLGFRHTPCTCSIREVIRPQSSQLISVVESTRINISPPPG